MVSRTQLGLEAMLSGRAEMLEHGLVAVASPIDFPGVGRLSVLARDSAGLPVLVFAFEGDHVALALAQVAQVHAHLVAQPWLLQRLFEHRLPAAPLECLRVVLVGHRFDALALASLGRLSLPDLMVCELHEWTVAGERACALRSVLTSPPRDESDFSPPSATPATHVEVAREVLTWLSRLDADVVVEADRYARVVRARGRLLCTLAIEAGEPWLALADGERSLLASRDAAMAAMDRVMAQFAASLDVPARSDAMAPAAADVDEDCDLGDLRRAVADVRVTRAECDALQFGESPS
ncbi:MAG: hypothetical protein R3F56_10865 [Planctomycetota bacterium]